MSRIRVFAFLLLLACLPVHGQRPTISHTQPGALRPGQTNVLTVFGKNLSGEAQLWTSFAAQVQPKGDNAEPSQAQFEIVLLADAPLGIGAMRLATAKGLSDLHLILIDDLPSQSASASPAQPENAQPLAPPVAIDAKGEPLKLHYYSVSAPPHHPLAVEVVAHRAGSEFDPVLRLLDANGRELAYCDDAPGLGADAFLQGTMPASGPCLIEVRDIRYQGGDRHWYRLRVGSFDRGWNGFLPVREPGFQPSGRRELPASEEREPNSTFETATPVTVPVFLQGSFARPNDTDLFSFDVQKGQRLVFAGQTRSIGSSCDLAMRLLKPDRSLVGEASIAGANEGTLTNQFSESGTHFLEVRELVDQGGPDFFYRIGIQTLGPGFDLHVEADRFEAVPGGEFELKVTCDRRNYDGPITLVLGGAAKGFEIGNHVIASKKNETQLKVTVPKQAKPGTLHHFTVLGYAKIGEEYHEAQASTLGVLRKLFPRILYPYAELDGLICLGIKAAEAAPDQAEK